MLMDYATEPEARRAPPEGVQVAGLLDLFELAARTGKKFAPEAMAKLREYATKDPLGFYKENRTFIDPRGDLTLNTGPTYTGRPIPRRDSVEQLRGSSAQAVNLATYLNDTEIGNLFRPEFDQINIGRAPASGNYLAYFSPPTANERGLLAINENIPKQDIPQLFEHELQHAIQFAQNKPQGASPAMVDDEFMDYMVAERGLDPAVVQKLDRLSSIYRIDPSELRYYATRGESEARAAEGIANQVFATGKPLTEPPSTRLYTTLPRHMPLTGFDKGLLYDIPQNTYADFLKYRRGETEKAGGAY